MSPVAVTWTAWCAWLAGLAATSVAVVLCVLYLDRPIALWAQEWFGTVRFVTAFVRTPGFFAPLVIAMLGMFAVRRLAARPLARPDVAILMCAASLIVGDAAKRQLKVVFGRTWPKFEHPSFIRDGVYGFNPFHAGHVFESFPSGHMTALCALVSVLWIYYPRHRPFYAASVLALAAGLVVGDYHFVSDVIAGGFLGISVGMLVAYLWSRVGARALARA